MSVLRALYAMARADFLERVRRYSFLVTLAATVWLGWLVVRGQVVMQLGEYSGAINGAWAGTMVAATLSTLVSLAGFWIVKGSVARDHDTRVGEILAATPLSKPMYTTGKALSNFAVLGAIVAVLALAAPVLVFAKGGNDVSVWPTLAPFLFIALPMMAVIAALAVLFETIRPLSGGAGNVLWFFVWSAMFAVPMTSGISALDSTGMLLVKDDAGAACKAVFPEYDGDFSFTIGSHEAGNVKATFDWSGIAWTPARIASRVQWFGVALLIALVAALPFDRFDDSKRTGAMRLLGAGPRAPAAKKPGWSIPLPSFLPPVYAGELKLLLNGQRWWYWVVVIGFIVAGLVAPADTSRLRILPFAWLWPVLAWSALGAREARDGTEELVFTAPHPLARQLPASYLAGVTVALLTGSGVAVKCLMSGSIGGLLGLVVGAFFIPAAALACGAWSAGSKLFEALYVVLWYIGPLQPVPALDFMAASDLTVAAGMPWRYAGAAVVLLAVAVAGRRWRMAR